MVDERVLVLGATGGFGGAVAHEFLSRQRRVRALVRDLEKARERFGDSPNLELVEGDVENTEVLNEAAQGCGAIVHGVNYGFTQWDPKLVEATANIIAAAKSSNSAILFPGNIYGFGLQTDRPLDEAAENKPTTAKGELRVRLEDSLRAASQDGVQAIILRAGDYFGPTVRNGLVNPLFGKVIVGRTMRTLGRIRIPRQWAYAPDLARAAVDLLDKRAKLAPFEVIHYAGYVVPGQRDFAKQIALAADYKGLKLKNVSWWLVKVFATVDPLLREVVQMRYLFENSVIIESGRFDDLLPGFAQTQLEEAISATVASYKAEWEKTHGKELVHRWAKERAAVARIEAERTERYAEGSEPEPVQTASDDLSPSDR